MSFFIFINVIDLNDFFYVNFCFVKNEYINDYIWMLETMQEFYKKLQLSSSQIILSNNDKIIASTIINIYDTDEIHHKFCI